MLDDNIFLSHNNHTLNAKYLRSHLRSCITIYNLSNNHSYPTPSSSFSVSTANRPALPSLEKYYKPENQLHSYSSKTTTSDSMPTLRMHANIIPHSPKYPRPLEYFLSTATIVLLNLPQVRSDTDLHSTV